MNRFASNFDLGTGEPRKIDYVRVNGRSKTMSNLGNAGFVASD